MSRPKRVTIEEFNPHSEDDAGITQLAKINARFRLNDAGRVYCVELGRNTADEHVQYLSALQCLTEVNLVYFGKIDSRITDDGIRQIIELPNIEYLLCVDQPLITNAALRIAATSKTITRLGFPGTAIDDNGVSHLNSMQQLIALGLDHTTITDRSVDCILGLPRLQVLTLMNTDISNHGMRTLVNGLPNLRRFQYSKRDRTKR